MVGPADGELVYARKNQSLWLSPATESVAEARRWFHREQGLDGIIAKRLDASYGPGKRSGAIVKIKRLRTAECVVDGFRYAEKKGQVGSLLLLADVAP